MAYSLWESQSDHDHENKLETRLPLESVKVVKQCINDNIKSTKMIINKIKQQQLPQLTSKQIANLKAQIQKMKKLIKVKKDLKIRTKKKVRKILIYSKKTGQTAF